MTLSKKETYRKLNPIDHMLLRSDMYIGDVKNKKVSEYVFENDKISLKNINNNEGLVRIFVEIISNAIDNYLRSEDGDNPVKKIKVKIDKTTGETSVYNDGEIIPIKINKSEGVYNHSLIFGNLLSGSNFDDNQDRFTSGKNGIGSSATNIFSTKFKVVGVDPANSSKLSQVWTGNMKKTKGPKITKNTSKKGYTEVTWFPDFHRFGLEGYTDHILNVMKRVVYDTSMLCDKTNVYFNDELIKIKKIQNYASFYENFDSKESVYMSSKDCEVILSPSPNTEYQEISFVNGIYTKNGGCHVDKWMNSILKDVSAKLNKKDKCLVSKRELKQYFRIFVKAKVNKPIFDSQSKHKLESPEIEIDYKKTIISKIMKWSVIKDVEDLIKSKEMLTLKKTQRKKKGFVRIEGMDQANLAGTKYSNDCTLVLCEGLSAKTYVICGLSIGIEGKKGRDYTGIMSLTGKILNTRNAPNKIISKNKEVTNLIKALGLEYGVDYTKDANFDKLRYGKIALLADADCFTEDTPLLVKKDNFVDIMSIKTLSTKDIYCYEIWSSNGWTKILGLKEKNTSKKILMINTYCGITTVTEDHLCILEDGKEVKARDLKIGDKLMRTRKTQKISIDDKMSHSELKNIANRLQCYKHSELYNKNSLINAINNENDVCNKLNTNFYDSISEKEAWVWGFFFAEGTCGIYAYSWSISNCNKELLERCKTTLETIYKEQNWSLVDVVVKQNCSRQYRLILNGGKSVKEFIETFRNRFYDSNNRNNKKVPFEILNGSKKIKQAFFNGYYDGDGFRNLLKTKNAMGFDILGQIGAQGLYYICEDLGYSCSVRPKKTKSEDVYTIVISKRFKRKYPGEIRKIETIDYKGKYVYDIETENHKLNTGIGGIITHNCDGIHIESLLLNLFHSLFPSLLKRPEPFIISLKTPIVRIINKKKQDILFYDSSRADDYIKTNSDKNIKYYKGLGTTKTEDVPDTFGKKIVKYKFDKKTDYNMNKVFDKKQTDERKKWLTEYNPETHIYSLDDFGHKSELNISDFLNEELIKFSLSDCERSIPSLLDGFKTSQRKIFYCVKKRNLSYNGKSLKVAQLAGYVAEHSNYHHGEQNLYDTITKMAQDFIGSNNVPLLYRDGQMGSRIQLGKDAASARYIYTKMDKNTEYLFPKDDDVLLERVVDDGDIVEPKFYIPIIPLILVNGVNAGIGTGFSCNIPSYNPDDIIEYIKYWLEHKTLYNSKNQLYLKPLVPWYRNFKGSIEKVSENKYKTSGIIKDGKSKGVYKISEIPINVSIDKFKEKLEEMYEQKTIKKVVNHSTQNKVDFTVYENPKFVINEDNLKLHSYISTSNMVLFDEKNTLTKYENVYEIIEKFCSVRLDYYVRRKKYQLKEIKNCVKFLNNKRKFITEVMNKTLNIMNIDEKVLITQMETKGYDKKDGSYEYLLGMQIRTFTKNKIETLRFDIKKQTEKMKSIETTSAEDMWKNELDLYVKNN